MHILITDLLGNRTDFVRGGARRLAAHSNPYGLQIMMPALACISAEQPRKWRSLNPLICASRVKVSSCMYCTSTY